MVTEIVLPHGRFANVRTITVADMLEASKHQSGMDMLIALASLTCTLDGETMSYADWLATDYAEIVPVIDLLCKQLRNAFKTRDGVA